MLDNFETLKLYKMYLNTLQAKLDEYFENQKEYICCKEGCSHCCEKGEYPYSKIEWDYLLIGFFKLDNETQQKVILNIQKLKEEYSKIQDKKEFLYKCPFLNENGLCSVYNYRGIVCRTFGILHLTEEGKATVPFCYEYGLNYSKVYDKIEHHIDFDKVKEFGYKNPPYAYSVTMKTLLSKNVFKDNSFDFGEVKPLIEWL